MWSDTDLSHEDPANCPGASACVRIPNGRFYHYGVASLVEAEASSRRFSCGGHRSWALQTQRGLRPECLCILLTLP
jgi:hypothetical protein